jgi:DNA-binding NtrC family response regulator
LVVDDERNIRRILKMVLESEGAAVSEARSATEALEHLGRPGGEVDVVVMDVKMPGMSGIDALERLAADGKPNVPIIMISGHATVTDAVKATRLGAFDFFEKPLARERVIVSVRNALERSRAVAELTKLRRQWGSEILGRSPVMLRLMQQIEKVASSKARVLIQGESGTGKELVARAIHEASGRSHATFVKINCAAIPSELIESELFGHERGAFTGANARKRGLFEVADGGTLLLDEVGDMDLNAQAKVLRVIQTGEFMRVGGEAPIEVDVRVMAATHRNLQECVQRREFREDLYFRLAVVPLGVPPLRDRRTDVAELARHFIDEACRENGLAGREISPRALAALAEYDWPGNIRELRNVMERMVVLCEGDLDCEDLPDEIVAGGASHHRAQRGRLELTEQLAEVIDDRDSSLRSVREAVERAFIVKRLVEHGWNVSRAAESLGLERTHLHRKMRLLQIQRGTA